ARGQEMLTAIRRISLTLDEQDPNDLAIMGEMITALGATNQPEADSLIDELTNWKSGRELAEKGQYLAAVDAYSRTVELNPYNLAARYDRAIVYITLGQFDTALTDLDRIVDIAKRVPTPTPQPIVSTTTYAIASSVPLQTTFLGVTPSMIPANQIITL